MYISLHNHFAKGSIGDSILTVKDAIAKTKEFGADALAITDHGSLRNIVEFYTSCKDNGIKPILGLEAYEVADNTVEDKEEERWHLLLLAKNDTGYKNLLKISANAHTDGFYRKPRTCLKILEQHGAGIIAASACVGGRIPSLIMDLHRCIEKNDKDGQELYTKRIADLINSYKECFDEFYLELQPGNFYIQETVNRYLVRFAKYTHTKMIVTNDVHYLNPEDYIYHNYHVKLSRLKDDKDKNIDKDELIYPDKCYYMMSEEDLRFRLSYIPEGVLDEAIDNTKKIADEVSYGDLFNSKIKMPPVDYDKSYSIDDYLAKLAYDKLDEISYKLPDPSVYYAKLDEELSVLKTVGFSSYLLTVLNFYDYAKAHDILLGPGRGSICGSLTAYLIGLTKVDPIKYGLKFSRFTSIYRVGSVPDIDTDCIGEGRDKLYQYAIKRYGFNNCAQISTYCLRKAKGALRDTARLFKIPDKEVSSIVNLIPEAYYDKENDNEKKTDISIKFAIEITPELKKISERPEYAEWFDAAEHLEGLPSHISKHAAGMVVSPVSFDNYLPCYINDNGMLTTEFTLTDVEKCGGIKYDFLAVNNLKLIQDTMKAADINIDLTDDEFYKDEDTWNMISSGKTSTLFQINSFLYRKRLGRIKPRSIEELANCLALIRTPCISSKLDEKYMRIQGGNENIELIHPIYDKVTENTNGILLFQEQLMDLLVGLGTTKERGFQIMKYGTKKKMKKLDEAKQEVHELAKDKMDDATFEKIWHVIYFTGLFCFNKSHAVAYAIVTYLTAYLCCHYPLQWYASAINKYYECDNTKENKIKLKAIIEECNYKKIKLMPVDVNKSGWLCVPEGNEIRLGYVCVKGLGEKSAEILEGLKGFDTYDDFYTDKGKCKAGKKFMECSIFAGALDAYGDRIEMYNRYCESSKVKERDSITIGKTKYSISSSNLDTIQHVLLSTDC